MAKGPVPKKSFTGWRLIFLAATGLVLGATLARASEQTASGKQPPSAEQLRFFETQVQPILRANCWSCHGAEKKVKGGLHLTSRDALLKGGNTGPAVSLASPAQSLLLQAIHYGDLKMPPKGKLPQAQIDILTRWVEMGVPWPAEATATAKRHGPPPVDDQARQFWAFRPVVRPPIPGVDGENAGCNPIDAFIAAKRGPAGLKAAPPADKAALLRRVYYDLVGLPPTPADVQAFLADSSPRAYEKVVDRLLASPHYGERWARHWLDLVRYAETNSFERDGAKPNVWRYRDYVIRSFNEDKPYDQFVREQLDGDELEPTTTEALVATGYYRLGQWDDEPADRVQAFYDEMDDVVSTTGQVFLGLTVGCARCHDHKIDPFPQKDYYRLLAFFHGIQRYGPGPVAQRSIAGADDQRTQEEVVAAHQKMVQAVMREITAIEEAVRPRLEGGERDDFKYEMNRPGILKRHVPEFLSQETLDRYLALHKKRRDQEKKKPSSLAQALCVTEAGPTPRDTFVFARGNPHAPGEKVEPGFPSVLTTATPALPPPSAGQQTSGRRRALADWIVSPENPLTARVMANRLWQYHFGRGIVRSSSNFGYQGTPPTHPELLDWLASELVARGWRLKAIHKLILMSDTYRMASRPDPAALARDPENDLLWRFEPRRLDAEEVRDSVLAVCGNLNLQRIGGPSIYPVIPKEVLAGQSRPGDGWNTSPPGERDRRSVYIHVKRSLAVPILNAFDAADTDASCPVRFTTTQPAQALALLNSDFLNEQAGVFADDLRRRAGDDPAKQVRLALWPTLQREPSAGEVERGICFLARMRQRHRFPPEEALRSFCLLALNLNGFLYLD